LTVINDIIHERESKITILENKIKVLDEELYDKYKDLEYFYNKRRLDQ